MGSAAMEWPRELQNMPIASKDNRASGPKTVSGLEIMRA
jgi:hypothetical protein